ncbi:MAG: ScyD/ScyE family protein [Acidimicrobiia bacterium]
MRERRRAQKTRRKLVTLGAALAVAVAPVLAQQARATTPTPGPVVVAGGLDMPLQMDVGAQGRILVTQATKVSVVDAHGNVSDLVDTAPAGPGGVAFAPFGGVLFTTSDFDAGEHLLKVRDVHGNVRTLADLGAYEKAKNPDQVNTYGFKSLPAGCADQIPDELKPFVLPYKGLVDSHPYALAATPLGVFVAEAGGNDILFVDWFGRIRTTAVLPPIPVTVTAAGAAANGLPPCVAGRVMRFEPVPTDVELSRAGKVLVTSLPGGVEDDSLGYNGSVFEVNPWGGRPNMIAKGFGGATNLAVAGDGSIYVAELFAGRVSKVVHGGPAPVADLEMPAALEWCGGRLFATTNIFVPGGGDIVRFSP